MFYLKAAYLRRPAELCFKPITIENYKLLFTLEDLGNNVQCLSQKALSLSLP